MVWKPKNELPEGAVRACDHKWAVFSTALADGWLMVQCVTCGAHGSVEEIRRRTSGRRRTTPQEAPIAGRRATG